MSILIRITTVVLLSCIPSLAADWATWLGPHRDGKSAETGLPASWPEGGPELVWSATGLGEGYASMAVVGNRVYTQGQEAGQEFVLALDVATGNQIWKTAVGKAYENPQGNGPRGMPQVDGDRVYAVSAEGNLVCLATETGEVVWDIYYADQFDSIIPKWGFTESPLVDGGRLVINPGGKNAGIVALDKATGDVIWQSQNDLAAYSSVLAFDFGGLHIYAAMTASAAIGVNAEDGSLLWRYEKASNGWGINIATPVYADGHVFYSTDYDHGSLMLRLSAEGGTVTASEVYFTGNMQNHFMTSVKIGDHLYGFSGNQPAILVAMKFETGEVAWRDRSVNKGNCILAEGLLYCQGETGVIGLIEPSPEGYREISRFQISRGRWNTWAYPAIANGRLYIRDQDNLYAYDISR